jgi:hypothetical protein
VSVIILFHPFCSGAHQPELDVNRIEAAREGGRRASRPLGRGLSGRFMAAEQLAQDEQIGPNRSTEANTPKGRVGCAHSPAPHSRHLCSVNHSTTTTTTTTTAEGHAGALNVNCRLQLHQTVLRTITNSLSSALKRAHDGGGPTQCEALTLGRVFRWHHRHSATISLLASCRLRAKVQASQRLTKHHGSGRRGSRCWSRHGEHSDHLGAALERQARTCRRHPRDFVVVQINNRASYKIY